MEFKQAVIKRYSMRQFQPTGVPENLVREIIELAKLAPSAGNLQAYKVVVSKEKVTNVEAPLSLVICADPKRSASRYGARGKSLYAVQDATIFAAYLQLAIVNAGLASVWVGAFKEGRIRNLLKIPESLRPVAVICLGYPVGEKSGKNRRKYEEIMLPQE